MLLNCGVEKTLESPLDFSEVQPVNPECNQPWIFIGRTDAEAEASILWPPNTKSWLIGKDPNAGKVWRQEEKELTEDKMVGWHHRLNGLEFEQAFGDAEGQGGLVCCSPWGHEEFDTTEQPNSNKQCLEKGIYNLLYWSAANLQCILLYSKVIRLYICIRSLFLFGCMCS